MFAHFQISERVDEFFGVPVSDKKLSSDRHGLENAST